jgi:hypothetical protein
MAIWFKMGALLPFVPSICEDKPIVRLPFFNSPTEESDGRRTALECHCSWISSLCTIPQIAGPAFISPVDAEGDVRAKDSVALNALSRVLGEQAAISLDAVLFDNVAADTTRSVGLLAGVVPIGATAGGGTAAMVGDVALLADAIGTAGGDPNRMTPPVRRCPATGVG